MDDIYAIQEQIPYYLIQKDPKHIDFIIKHQKLKILQNVSDLLTDGQHYTIRYKTYRNEYDSYSFLLSTELDLFATPYRNYTMATFSGNDGLGGFIQQPDKKIDWRCVYCGHMQPYEITTVKRGKEIKDVIRKCLDCGGPKLS